MSRASMSADAAAVFIIGLGAWLIDKEKIARIMSSKY